MGQRPDEIENVGYADATVEEYAVIEPYSDGRADDLNPAGAGREELYAGMSGQPSAWQSSNGDDNGDSGNSDIEATRHDIEETRSQMSSTIDAIEQKLSPGNLVHEAKDAVREATIGKAGTMVDSVEGTAKDVGSGIIETIKQNPVPAGLAALGIGWLLMSGRKSSTSSYGTAAYRPSRYGPAGCDTYGTGYRSPYAYGDASYGGASSSSQGSGNTLSNATQSAQQTAGQVVQGVQSTAGDMAQGVQDTASDIAGQVGDTAAQIADQAQSGMQQASSGFQQMLQQNPLAVAAGALAVGVAVGLAIPETPQENRLMGPAHDEVMNEAQQLIQEKTHQAQQAAQSAIGAAQNAAEDALQSTGSSNSKTGAASSSQSSTQKKGSDT